jgi:hypothetical protein
VFRDPSNSYICLGANASYTNEKKGRIGFQFVRVEFQEKGVAVRVWPYILDDRRNEFVPDRERWKVSWRKKVKYFLFNYSRSIFLLKPPTRFIKRKWSE